MGNRTWQRQCEVRDHEQGSVVGEADCQSWLGAEKAYHPRATYQAVGGLSTESSTDTHDDKVEDDTVHSSRCRIVVGITKCENKKEEDGCSQDFRAEGTAE